MERAQRRRMESALDEIEFLALSQNRVDALRYLAERPHSRRELVERTGASQATLGRISLTSKSGRGFAEQGVSTSPRRRAASLLTGSPTSSVASKPSGGCATSSVSPTDGWPSSCNIWPTPRAPFQVRRARTRRSAMPTCFEMPRTSGASPMRSRPASSRQERVTAGEQRPRACSRPAR